MPINNCTHLPIILQNGKEKAKFEKLTHHKIHWYQHFLSF